MARILVIDDDPEVRMLVVHDLKAAGHDVSGASNGAEGLAMQRSHPADLVVTDIYMPEKEGIETIRELREHFPAAKVIAISGGGRLVARPFAKRELGVVTRELGVAAILEKPFGTKELLESVAAALGMRPS